MKKLGAGLLVLAAACASPAEDNGREVAPGTATVRVVLAGDVMLGRGVAPVVASDPDGVFADVRVVLASADLAVANLESPLTERAHSSANPFELEADPASAVLLGQAGFDVLGLANNHAGDAGPESVADTVAALEAAGLTALGGGANASEAGRPVIEELGGIRVALLAYDVSGQGLPAGEGPGVASWDPAVAEQAIAAARDEADVVIVGIHGGIEYLGGRDPMLAPVAEQLARWNVDVVWGHGPHVVQPTDVVDPDGDGRPSVVATSLGNLLFDQPSPATTRGGLLEVLVDAGGVVAYRTGVTEHADRRVHFAAWDGPRADAGFVAGGWWSLVRVPDAGPVALPPAGVLDAFAGGDIVAAALGDVTADGETDLVVAFRRPFRETPITRRDPGRQWADAQGRSAHLGVYRPHDLAQVWVAGMLLVPVGEVAVCDGAAAVGFTTFDDADVVSTGAFSWDGFGFTTSPTLDGPGRPQCLDVDGDGRSDPVILDRSS